MKATFFTVDTPDGPFSVITAAANPESTEQAVVISAGWTESRADLAAQIHPTLRPTTIVDSAPDADIAAAVADYYAGDFSTIGTIAVQQKSGPFRSHAWEVLRQIPAGEPVTYRHYAELAGNPQAARAAASACANNAVALFVPCHRIVRTDGTLGGFRWGVAVKRSLLAREAAQASPS